MHLFDILPYHANYVQLKVRRIKVIKKKFTLSYWPLRAYEQKRMSFITLKKKVIKVSFETIFAFCTLFFLRLLPDVVTPFRNGDFSIMRLLFECFVREVTTSMPLWTFLPPVTNVLSCLEGDFEKMVL